jgi:hypothetical protein
MWGPLVRSSSPHVSSFLRAARGVVSPQWSPHPSSASAPSLCTGGAGSAIAGPQVHLGIEEHALHLGAQLRRVGPGGGQAERPPLGPNSKGPHPRYVHNTGICIWHVSNQGLAALSACPRAQLATARSYPHPASPRVTRTHRYALSSTSSPRLLLRGGDARRESLSADHPHETAATQRKTRFTEIPRRK